MSLLVFPDLPGVNISVKRTPEWKTQVKEALNGQETRIAQRSWPRWRYSLSFDVLRSGLGYAERAQLEAFFLRHRGRFASFLFRDPEENAVVNQQFGTGDGASTVFQLTRTKYDWQEPVWAPATSPAPVIQRNGVVLTAGADYSISATGLVQTTTPPVSGAVLAWSGAYYMRMRFVDDNLDFDRFLAGLWKADKVELLSEVFE